MKGRSNIAQVEQIAAENARFVEATVVRVFPQTRTAQVRLDGSGQYINISLGYVDPSEIGGIGARLLLYRSGTAFYTISAVPGQYAPSSAGVTLGDRWGSNRFDIFSSATYNPFTYGSTYSVASIDSLGNIRYCGDLMAVRDGVEHIGGITYMYDEPLTNDDFSPDGSDSFSTVSSNTEIKRTDWSSTLPLGVKALIIKVEARDSGSASSNCWFGLYNKSDGTKIVLPCRPYGRTNDAWDHAQGRVACVDGSIWYQCMATSTNTLDVRMWVLGYVI